MIQRRMIMMMMMMMMKLSCTSRFLSHEKREWLRDLLLDEAKQDVYVENIGTHYEDIESLNKLDVTHIFRCQKHVKNYALQNVFKLFNW